MTKTLTEQWREGTLPRGGYYIKLQDGSIKQTDYDNISKTFDTEFFKYNVSVKEVLAPVPSYDEYCNLVFQANKPKNPLSDVMMCYDAEREKKVLEPLQKKLAIATKALKKYQESINSFKKDPMNNIIMLAHQLIYDIDIDSKKALKEMEGVK